MAAAKAAKAAEAAESAAFDALDAVARAAHGLKPRRTAEGASGSGGSGGGSGGTPTTAEPPTVEMKTERAPPRVIPLPQSAVSEEAAGVAADDAAKSREGGTAAATYAPDRDTLVEKLHTFATSATAGIIDETVSWAGSEFPGDFAALAAAAEGGEAKAQLAMGITSNLSAKERAPWLFRAMDTPPPLYFTSVGW